MNATETLRHAFQLFEQEHYAAAEEALFGLLQQEPDHLQALHLLGSVAAAQGRFEEAAVVLQRALRVLPHDAQEGNEALAIRYKLGRAFYEQGRVEDAFLLYRDLIETGYRLPELFVAAAAALQALSPAGKNDEQAIALLDEALQLQPDSPDTWHRKALLHERRRDWAAARASMHRVLQLDGRRAVYWLDAGLAEHALGEFEEALKFYDQALIVDPDYVDAHVSRGTSLARLRQYDDAIDSYRRALALQPDDADAKVNLAFSLLVLGRMQEALPLYEWRWEGRSADPYRHAAIPAWNGASSLRGKRMLLWAEQGHGDTIQFSRYVQQIVEAGAQVVLEVPAALLPLMASLPSASQLELVAMGAPLPALDYQLPLMSLALVCNTQADDIPAPVPYLRADEARLQAWSARIDTLAPRASGRLRVGIVCSGNAGNVNDRRRSIALEQFAPLAQARADLDFFILQPDLRAADAVWLAAHDAWHWLGAGIGDFADTAAALACMDLLVTVDTAAAHLAGALGLPVWIALPFAPDWRWFLNRHDSPWYPTARLLRQQRAGEWGDVILTMKAALAVSDLARP
ncbi:tetratricopeptide repeat protein [Herbaspirillum sp. LeCh32-8]|uniref:tetratricopeptide repeat protein n=1 Tax=Herbaspirillum sp. LeCh32-8 TaxID=2821356 RepID=UPI001AE91439|nr:tetratricopeptide repeat protein [Herbaspirillum sp. LeCh32-8]MBP0596692.1 tetratricopeptide repeat protein [Herbaspirillum sp. LeCh32-8]